MLEGCGGVLIIERVFATLQEIYRQILTHGGVNQFKLPYFNARKRQRDHGQLIDFAVSNDIRLSGVAARDRIANEVLAVSYRFRASTSLQSFFIIIIPWIFINISPSGWKG
jgi:hypothetical protein